MAGKQLFPIGIPRTGHLFATMILSVIVLLAGCSAPNSPGFLDGLSGGKSSMEAVKEFEAFLADVKKETPDFVKKGLQYPESHFPEAHKRMRPGMAQKDANDLLNTIALVYLMNYETKFTFDPANVEVKDDTAKIEGDDLQISMNGKTTPGQSGGAFTLRYVDNKWYVAEMVKPF
ncbi:hypothetical protein ACFRJ9_14645 [Paenarthrobacter sp. NPDC056912]|uniref:hypothetical protein n=1 Tax=Paenarthrobacter sp. NPDC056912 TaxID=3345965 RepID=UPI00366ACC03